MIKSYNGRVVFGADDASIGGPIDAKEMDDFLGLEGEVEVDLGTSSEDPSVSAEVGNGKKEKSDKVDDSASSDESSKSDAGTEGIDELDLSDEGSVEGDTGASVVLPEPESDVEALRAQVESLTKIINDLAGDSGKAKAKSDNVSGDGSADAPPSVTTQALMESFDFDEVMESKENFVKFLIEFASTVKTEAAQATLQSIPSVVGSVVQHQTTLRDVAIEFYKAHPELKPVKQYVGRMANEISATNPDWGIQQVLDDVAVKAKDVLGLKAVAQGAEKKAASKPSLPGGTRSPKSSGKAPTGLLDEINDLLND